MRMFDPLAAFPFPILGLPVFRIFVSCRLARISDIRRSSREIRRSKIRARQFPASRIRCPSRTHARRCAIAERGDAGGNRHLALPRRGRRIGKHSGRTKSSAPPANCAADTPASRRASSGARSRRAAAFRPRARIRRPQSRELCSLSSSRSRPQPVVFLHLRDAGPVAGSSVGSPPPTGSIPNAKSLSNSGSCDARSERPLSRFQSKASRCPR